MSSLPWVSKYTPKSSADIPQPKAVQQLKDAIAKGRKGIILVGPTGSCKTSAVYALAAELGWEVFETNASDFRDAESIKSKLGLASRQRSLFFPGKIMLVDDIDCLSGTKDRGCVGEVVGVIEATAFPVIMTASDVSESKFSALRRKSAVIEFPAVETQVMLKVLQGICAKESVRFEDAALRTICHRAGGDLRAAINDLQTFAPDITVEAVKSLSDRDRDERMQSALFKVFKSAEPEVVLGAFDLAGADPGEVILWIEENIPAEYAAKEDLARAFDVLSRADVFRGRIMNRQHWRFLSYVFELLTAGVATAKDQRKPGISEYKMSGRPLRIWIYNNKFAKRKAIAEKLSGATHASLKSTIKHTMPYVQALCKHNKSYLQELTSSFQLAPEEVEYLVK